MRFTHSQCPNQEMQGLLVYGEQYRRFSYSHDPRRKETNRNFPKLTNFDVCHQLHVYPTQTANTGALTFLCETMLKQNIAYQYQISL